MLLCYLGTGRSSFRILRLPRPDDKPTWDVCIHDDMTMTA